MRLRSAIRITINVNAYERQIEALRSDSADLRTIGSYRSQPAAKTSACRKMARGPVCDSDQIRKATKALHQTLGDAWCCANATHAEHAAKLCLQARVEDGVRLELALSCSKRAPDFSMKSDDDPPLWLYVRSITEISQKSPATHTTLPPACIGQTLNIHKKKKVRMQPGPSSMTIGRDLRQSASFCDSLSMCTCLTLSEECLGYLESSDDSLKQLKHLFYHRCAQKPAAKTTALEISLPALLDQSRAAPGLLSVEDQLHLAYNLALSLLQLYSTPWLANDWRSRDIAIFQLTGQPLKEALSTAHVTTAFRKPVDAQVPAPPASLESQGCSDEQIMYGVPNLTLFSLGIALLEIGHKQSLEGFRTPRDQNSIFTARRLAQRPSSLGQRYQMIAHRCLQCDFGCGSELDKEELRSAVYTDVVCQLGEMLEAFKI